MAEIEVKIRKQEWNGRFHQRALRLRGGLGAREEEQHQHKCVATNIWETMQDTESLINSVHGAKLENTAARRQTKLPKLLLPPSLPNCIALNPIMP